MTLDRELDGQLLVGRGWRRTALAVLVVGALGLAAACGGNGGGNGDAGPVETPRGIPTNIGKDDRAQITGAGATFPAAIYQAWFEQYHFDVAPGVEINYQSIGSGGGVQQFTERTVDFGASDAPMSEEELARAPDTVHLPTVLGSVVMAYNLADVADLKLDGPTISAIYRGEVRRWSDPAIAALNPGARLPDADIQVVYRSDGSGTTFVFTDYLSTVSAEWKTVVGTSKNPSWPVGQGGKGNEGVSNVVKQTPNAIGYIELQYAHSNQIPFAQVKNQAGQFVEPSIASTSAAAAGVALPPDYRASIVNAAGADAYPIASFTYLLLHRDAPSCEKQGPLVRMLWWLYHSDEAAQTAEELLFGPLPEDLIPRIEETLMGLTCEGQPILPVS